jgi:hypothetical protein
MSDYSKATNFTSKDTLPTGNSGKIVKGTELDTEFTAISSAIASKADISSPALLGTPTTPTATTGTNTTQIASTAFVKTAVDTATTALGLGNMSTQAKSAVDITGGTIVGITDLAVADGGTGRSTLTDKAVLIGAGTSGINSVSPGTTGNVLTSNGTNWTSAAPATIKGLGLGGEVWNDVTASRAASSTYTNNNAYPIMVNIWGINAGVVTLTIGGVAVSKSGINSNVPSVNLTGIVPPGLTYSISSCGSIVLWSELY